MPPMRFLRIQYDAYNRQFKLLDKDMAQILEDGETYLLADFSPTDFSLTALEEPLEAGLPHA